MITLPPKSGWFQENSSDLFGSIKGSFNLGLSKKPGVLRVNRTIQTTTQTVNTNLTAAPVNFKYYGGYIWTGAGASGAGRVHASSNNDFSSAFTVDGTASTPTTVDSTISDIEVFNGALYVTAGSKLHKFTSGGGWNGGTSFTAGNGPWMMTTYGGRLYFTVGSLSKIYSTDDGTTIATPTSAYALALDTNFIPTWIRASSNRIWIGTIANSGRGYIYEWDGVSTAVTNAYRIDANGSLSCVIKNDIPWVIDTNGRLLAFSGGTFVEKARLPMDDILGIRALIPSSSVNNRFIHPNGMTISNDRINILINNTLGDINLSIPEFCPSGIWEYAENHGLYHRMAVSVLPVQTNSFTDYGQNRVSSVGGLAEIKLPVANAYDSGDLLIGAVINSNNSTTDAGIFTNTDFKSVSGTTGQYATQAYGYLVTPKILSSGVRDSWTKLLLRYHKFLVSGDKIVGKYRVSESSPTEITITWTSTSTFTTTTNVSGLEGYEVEIIQGTGSGKCAHITSISVTAGVFTVTLDDTFTGATSTGKARLQNWTKMGEITSTTDEFGILNVDNKSLWVQLKICFQMTGQWDFYDMHLINNIDQQLI